MSAHIGGGLEFGAKLVREPHTDLICVGGRDLLVVDTNLECARAQLYEEISMSIMCDAISIMLCVMLYM